MAPDINLYNGLIKATLPINQLSEEHPFLLGARADLEHYKKIIFYLFDLIKQLPIEHIRFSYNHEDIKYILNDINKANVYNIDHHHDLGYDDDTYKECTCANWAKYFLDNQIINNYTWIKNTNSDIKENIKYNKINLIDINLNTFLPKIDYLFICLSPEWVPEQYYPLFYLIVDYFNKQLNTHFTIY